MNGRGRYRYFLAATSEGLRLTPSPSGGRSKTGAPGQAIRPLFGTTWQPVMRQDLSFCRSRL